MSRGENILVAGGAGYGSSHVCKALAQAGLTPVIVDRLNHGKESSVKWGPLEILDLQDGSRSTKWSKIKQVDGGEHSGRLRFGLRHVPGLLAVLQGGGC